MFGIRNIYYSNDEGNIIKERVDTIVQTHITDGQRRYYQHLSDLGCHHNHYSGIH